MTKLCFQYLTIFSNENVPNSTQIMPKWVVNFAQKQIDLENVAKDFELFAKVVEFRQISSHWKHSRALGLGPSWKPSRIAKRHSEWSSVGISKVNVSPACQKAAGSDG